MTRRWLLGAPPWARTPNQWTANAGATEVHRWTVEVLTRTPLAERAGDEIRTRDFQLGRLTLYQLSYSRIVVAFGLSQTAKTLSRVRRSVAEWREKDSNLRRQKPPGLQPGPFGHSGTPPSPYLPAPESWRSDSNQQPAAYKTAALPIELRQHPPRRGTLVTKSGGPACQVSAAGPRRAECPPPRKH